MALVQQKAQAAGIERIGFLNPLLYRCQASHPDVFHDVVRGGNLVETRGPAGMPRPASGSPVVSVLADAIIETLRGAGRADVGADGARA